MVNEKKENKRLLTITGEDGNQREIFENDLNDITRPLVDEIRQDLRAEQDLMQAYQLAMQTQHHMESVKKNISNAITKLQAELPPVKKPAKTESVIKEIN